MSQNKKPLGLLILLTIALIGAILFLSWKLEFTSKALGYGQVDSNLNAVQTLRYSIQIYLARESLTKEKTLLEIRPNLEIQSGETVSSICNHLNLLFSNMNPKLCRDYLVYRGLDRKIEPGSYSIPVGMPAYQVFQFISDPANRNQTLVIYPGWRLEEIASAIRTLGLPGGGSDGLLENLRYPDSALAMELQLVPGQSLEGYLLPGEYTFGPDLDSPSLIWQLTEPTRQLLMTDELQSKSQMQGLTSGEVLTLASIIQRETLYSEEMPRMTSVFFNRLAQRMPLQTDPTVQYALGYDQNSVSWWKPVLSLSDLQVDSIYNTYQIQGLPPSPICAPGNEAIQAVLNPERTNFLYFRAKCDGSGLHDFSVTYQEHLSKACP
jgi:UPF0755 protein